MKKRMTASEAYAIATKWQENKCSDYVDKALEIIEIRANQGYFTADIPDPSPNNVNRDECIKAMKELGYIFDHSWTSYIRWRWG